MTDRAALLRDSQCFRPKHEDDGERPVAIGSDEHLDAMRRAGLPTVERPPGPAGGPPRRSGTSSSAEGRSHRLCSSTSPSYRRQSGAAYFHFRAMSCRTLVGVQTPGQPRGTPPTPRRDFARTCASGGPVDLVLAGISHVSETPLAIPIACFAESRTRLWTAPRSGDRRSDWLGFADEEEVCSTASHDRDPWSRRTVEPRGVGRPHREVGYITEVAGPVEPSWELEDRNEHQPSRGEP